MKPGVLIATPCTRDIPLDTMKSYLATQQFCAQNGIPGAFCWVTGTMIHNARSRAAYEFLQSDAELLFFIDSDMVWTTRDFLSVLTWALKYDCVVGFCSTREDPPTAHTQLPSAGPGPNEDGLVEIIGAGLAFACVRRRVIEHLSEASPRVRYVGRDPEVIPGIFRFDISPDGEARGEDYAFWADVKEAGFRVWADTSVSIGHIGSKIYTVPHGDSTKSG